MALYSRPIGRRKRARRDWQGDDAVILLHHIRRGEETTHWDGTMPGLPRVLTTSRWSEGLWVLERGRGSRVIMSDNRPLMAYHDEPDAATARIVLHWPTMRTLRVDMRGFGR
jgi:hypothetical protein